MIVCIWTDGSWCYVEDLDKQNKSQDFKVIKLDLSKTTKCPNQDIMVEVYKKLASASMLLHEDT